MLLRFVLLSFFLSPLGHAETFSSLHSLMSRFHQWDCALAGGSNPRVVPLAQVRALFEKAKEQQEESRIARYGESVCSVENVLYSPTIADAGLKAVGSYYGPVLKVKMSEKRGKFSMDDSVILTTRETGFCLDEKSDGSISLSQSVDVVGDIEHWDNDQKEMRNLKINVVAEFNSDGALDSLFYIKSDLNDNSVLRDFTDKLNGTRLPDRHEIFSCGKSRRSFLDRFPR